MSASLSRERIAELRRQALDLTDAHERAEALALLDAYEAQRPRPASEPTPEEGVYLVCLRTRATDPETWWTVAKYGGRAWGWLFAGCDVLAWLPMPPLPKGGDDE